MDDARLRALLHDLYAEGSSVVPPPPRRTEPKRRLHLRPVAAILATAAAAVAAVLIFMPTTPDSPARLVPIQSSPSTHPAPSSSVSIDLHPKQPIAGAPAWLPAGSKLVARTVYSPAGGAVLSYQLAGAANAKSGTAGLVQVWIVPNADGKAQFASNQRTPGNSYSAIHVNGHLAILTVPTNGIGGYSIQWFADNKKLMTVSMARNQTASGISGTSLDDLIHVADSVPK